VTSKYDIVVVGAGSNSLTTACYLAKAGLSVLVLEREEQCGGGVVSVHTDPRFTHDPHAMGYLMLLANPAIKDNELELETRFGLKFAYAPAPFASLYPDGAGLISYTDFNRAVKEIANISEADAKAYTQLVEDANELLPLLSRGFFMPPMPHDGFMRLLDSSDKGRKIRAELEGNVIDFLNARFTSPHVKVHLAKWASEVMTGPDQPGTGLTMYLILGLGHKYEMATVVGGAKSLTNALIDCLKHHGGELRTGVTVEQFIGGGGKIDGVITATGEEIYAKRAVVANIHPWDMGALIPGIDKGVAERAAAVKLSEYGALNQQIALSERIDWIGGPAYDEAILVECMEPDWDRFLRPFEAYRRDEFPYDVLQPLGGPQSNFDPSRAPEGMTALYLYSFAPYKTKDGWGVDKQKAADALFNWFCKFTKNIDSSKILGRLIECPPDHDAHSRIMRKGDIMGIAMTAGQLLGARPTPELAQYQIPGIDGLFLTGCTTHPGGLATLGGRASAMKIYQKLGIPLKCGFTNY
jgi:phytoene dehydrogenase-like protein